MSCNIKNGEAWKKVVKAPKKGLQQSHRQPAPTLTALSRTVGLRARTSMIIKGGRRLDLSRWSSTAVMCRLQASSSAAGTWGVGRRRRYTTNFLAGDTTRRNHGGLTRKVLQRLYPEIAICRAILFTRLQHVCGDTFENVSNRMGGRAQQSIQTKKSRVRACGPRTFAPEYAFFSM